MDNPYLPPAADLNESVDIGPDAPLQYAGFWRRFLARLIDILMFLPLVLIGIVFNSHYRLFFVYWVALCQVMNLSYYVYLVSRNGGTPGQRLLGVKIALCDGAAVTPKAAMLRYSVEFGLGLLVQLGWICAQLSMPDEVFHSLQTSVREERLAAMLPVWHGPIRMISGIWWVSEFVILLCNPKRRALQDFMAGTVVIRHLKKRQTG